MVRWLVPEGCESAAMITSRSRLPALPGAVRLSVPVLPPGQAYDLLGRILMLGGRNPGPAGSGGEAASLPDPSARQIVDAVGCLPLGIRAAAEQINSLRRIAGPEQADPPGGHTQRIAHLVVGAAAVRSRIDAALGDLPTRARGALARLSTLPLGPFGFDAASAALGEGAGQTEGLLDLLLEHSALTGDPNGTTGLELPRLLHLRVRELTPTGSGNRGRTPARPLRVHAACWCSLMRPASTVRRWIRSFGAGKTITFGSSFGARRSIARPWWLRWAL